LTATILEKEGIVQKVTSKARFLKNDCFA